MMGIRQLARTKFKATLNKKLELQGNQEFLEEQFSFLKELYDSRYNTAFPRPSGKFKQFALIWDGLNSESVAVKAITISCLRKKLTSIKKQMKEDNIVQAPGISLCIDDMQSASCIEELKSKE